MGCFPTSTPTSPRLCELWRMSLLHSTSQYFKEAEVLASEIVLALEHLHKVGEDLPLGCGSGHQVPAPEGLREPGSLGFPGRGWPRGWGGHWIHFP